MNIDSLSKGIYFVKVNGVIQKIIKNDLKKGRMQYTPIKKKVSTLKVEAILSSFLYKLSTL